MIAVFQALRFALGLFTGLVGMTTLVIGLWLADQEYCDLFKTGIYAHDFSVNGRPIPVSVILVVLGVTSVILLALSTLIICCDNPFAQKPRSP